MRVGHRRLPEVGGLDGLVRHDAVGRVEREERPVVHHGDPLGEPDHDLHPVLDHQHRAALVGMDGADHLDEPVDVLHGDAGHRLVEQDHARVSGEEHRDLELALVAVRQHPGRPRRARGEPDLAERVARPVERRVGTAPPAGRG